MATLRTTTVRSTLIAPGDVTLIAPQPTLVIPDAGPAYVTFVVPTDQDLSLVWQGGVSGADVQLLLTPPTPTEGPAPSSALSCVFDGGAGQGTVPASALAAVFGPPGTRSTNDTFIWGQSVTTTFAAGRWQVTMRVSSEVQGTAMVP